MQNTDSPLLTKNNISEIQPKANRCKKQTQTTNSSTEQKNNMKQTPNTSP